MLLLFYELVLQTSSQSKDSRVTIGRVEDETEERRSRLHRRVGAYKQQ
jgi:hypothetical protein